MDIEMNGQRKKFKPESLTSDCYSRCVGKMHDKFRKSNQLKVKKKLNRKDYFAASKNIVSSTPTCIETLEDEDIENGDHECDKHGFPENSNKPNESQQDFFCEEITDGQPSQTSFQEDLNEESEVEDVVEDDTLYSSSQDGLDESLSQEILYSSQDKQHFPYTSLQMNNQGTNNTKEKQSLIPCTSKSAYSGREGGQNRRPRMNDKFPTVPVPAHINQYGDCLKTRLGRNQYGLTLNDPPCQFFQGVLKGASGQTLAAMFGDVNLIGEFEGVSLDEVGHFVIDTTFKVIPNETEGINQVVTISLLYQNVVIPLWYAVTSCSSPELYKRILIEFQQHVLDWPFHSVLVNDDPALCKAVRAVFPDIDIYGSWFHYCYSIWKEIQLQNLTESCKTEDSILLMAVKLLMVIPYLPPSTDDNPSSVTMMDGFEYVREFARENYLPKEFNRVLNYVAVFWFNKVKPENFTLFGKHAQNHVEILQLLLLSFMKQNGNVWMLTRSFQNTARSTYADFTRFLNGKRMIAKKNRGKKFSAPIKVNIKKLMGGSLDMNTFLEKSTIYLEEILNIFLHPLYPTTNFEKTNYNHTDGWAIRICSD